MIRRVRRATRLTPACASYLRARDRMRSGDAPTPPISVRHVVSNRSRQLVSIAPSLLKRPLASNKTAKIIFLGMTVGALGLVSGPWWGGAWLSLALVNAGGAPIWLGIFIQPMDAMLYGAAYLLLSLAALVVAMQLWRQVQSVFARAEQKSVVSP